MIMLKKYTTYVGTYKLNSKLHDEKYGGVQFQIQF
jgi:hypothetical protein